MKKTIFPSTLIIIILISFSSCKKNKSECLTCPPPPPDTTSHIIQWQMPDTLGTQGIIRDVWVFDRNNAWAVGEIYLNDSTGKLIYPPFNIARWNGSKWELQMSIDIGFSYSQLYSIYAFAQNDVWVTTDIPEHWDGNKWTFYGSTRGYGGGFWIKKTWGLSSSNLYIVGDGGNIFHFNGISWTKMNSNTTVDLQDIWDIDGSHIWATGTNTGDGHCVVLQYNGTNWTTIYDNNTQPSQSQYGFSCLWTDNQNQLWLAGGSPLRKLILSTMTFTEIITGQGYVSYCIKGMTQNDIFIAGQASECAHYNGSSWHLYPELQNLNGGYAWFYSVHPTKDFVVLGGIYLTALNGFPVVVRGYR
ncbi:MAG: hypothetical protein ABR936_17170 [Bacteroidota bacterium]